MRSGESAPTEESGLAPPRRTAIASPDPGCGALPDRVPLRAEPSHAREYESNMRPSDDSASDPRPAWSQPGFEVEDEPTRSGGEARDEDELPRGAEGGASPDALVCYIRSISRTPILSREEQYALAERLERERFLDAVFAIPQTAAALVRRWRERQAARYVTATLSAQHLGGGEGDLSLEIDRALGAVERLLIRREGTARMPRVQAALDRRLALALRRADLAFDVIVDAFREVARSSRGCRRVRGGAELRARVAAAQNRLAAYEATKRTFV